MGDARPRARGTKLQEFTAHASAVNCLKIGRRSSGVMVTGGDDKKVNLWSVGRHTAIISLSGHQSPVECVTFDSQEEQVVAGAAGGTLKLWDLDEAKVLRTLTGHRSNCISVDFHPYGQYFASGSLDTNVKVWDCRSKGCIHTYKGHTRGVSTCRFSPDGRWIVSAGQDGMVKLWDLTTGRLLKDFPSHDGPVTDVQFHPNEFLLATSSADRTVKFWDLETFDNVSVAGPEATGVRSIQFTPDGRALLAASAEHLKVWEWEPARALDTVDVAWPKLADMTLYDGKVLGGSFHNSFVGVWVVDLSRVAPFDGDGGAFGRRTPPPTAPRAAATPPPPTMPAVPPPATAGAPSRAAAARLAAAAAAQAPATAAARAPSQAPAAQRPRVPSPPASQMVSVGTEMGDTLMRGAVSAEMLRAARDEALAAEGARGQRPAAPDADRRPPCGFPDVEVFTPESRAAGAAAAGAGVGAGSHQTPPQAAPGAPRPIGLDMDAFISSPAIASVADGDIMDQLLADHDKFCGILSARVTNLAVAQRFWELGDERAAVQAVEKAADPALTADFVSALEAAPDKVKLQTCCLVLPLLPALLESPHESHADVALACAARLEAAFGPLIVSTRAASPGPGGRGANNLALEERAERCEMALRGFRALSRPLECLRSASEGARARKARDVLDAVANLEAAKDG